MSQKETVIYDRSADLLSFLIAVACSHSGPLDFGKSRYSDKRFIRLTAAYWG